MRVLIVGSLDGQVGAAAQIAIKRGATVAQSDDIDNALHVLRSGEGADVVLVDVQLDVGTLTQSLSCLSMKLSKAAETQRMSHRGFQSLCHIRVRTVQHLRRCDVGDTSRTRHRALSWIQEAF